MRVQNEIDRFHLVEAAVNALPQLGNKGAYLLQKMRDTLVAHKQYISEYGMDLPEVRDWKWHTPENKIKMNKNSYFIHKKTIEND